MTICSLETASQFGSLALRVNGRTEAESHFDSLTGFDDLVFPALQKLLTDAQLRLSEVDCFAAGNGPGAFTGVRVALAAAKGLAEATRKPALGVSNLRALATFGQGKRRAVLLDARRGDVFAAVYDEGLNLIGTETVTKIDGWLGTLSELEYEFIAPPGASFLQALRDTRFSRMAQRLAARYLAAAVAECAEVDGLAGKWSDPAGLDASYVRRSDAEMFWTDTKMPNS